MTRLEQELLQFLTNHESVVMVAVRSYIEDMTKTAQGLQASYDSIKDNPEMVAIQDRSSMTTRGLKYSAQAIREAAESAQDALEALEKLAENAEGLE